VWISENTTTNATFLIAGPSLERHTIAKMTYVICHCYSQCYVCLS